jgi:hypothetical protein
MAALVEAARPLACRRIVHFGHCGTPHWPLTKTTESRKMESGDVGCVATGAKRNLAGNAPGMTALVEVVATLARRRIVVL